MKSLNITSSISYLFLFVLSAFFITSCETTIPDVDNTAPTLRFQISDPGLNEVMENPPTEFWVGPDGFDYLNLISGSVYTFSVIAQDEGGVSDVLLMMPSNIVVSLDDDEATTTTSGLSQIIQVTGNASEPVNGLVITGTMIIPPGLAFEYNFETRDYGGNNGSANARFMTVTANTVGQ